MNTVAALTQRELDVLDAAARGYSNAGIGQLLHLSERTVESHLGSVFSKLGLRDDVHINRRTRAVLLRLGAA